MMDFGPQQIGKWLIGAGVVIALVGGLMVPPTAKPKAANS